MNNGKIIGIFFISVGIILYYISKILKPPNKEVEYVKLPVYDPYELPSERYRTMFSS